MIDTKKFGKSRNLVQGDTLTLDCPAKGFPTPEVTWFMGDKMLISGQERVDIADKDGVKNAELKVYELDFADAGSYKCVANSSYTNFKNAEAIIEIRVKGRF